MLHYGKSFYTASKMITVHGARACGSLNVMVTALGELYLVVGNSILAVAVHTVAETLKQNIIRRQFTF